MHAVPYSDRVLIQRAIASIRPDKPTPRWVLVKHMFLCESTVAEAICWEYGFDPATEIGIKVLQPLDEKAYEENLLQHGVSEYSEDL